MRRSEVEWPPGLIYCGRESGRKRGSHLVQGNPIWAADFGPPGAICRIQRVPADNFAEYKRRLLAPCSNAREIFQSTGPAVQNRLRPTLALFLAAAVVALTFDILTVRRFKAKI